MILQSVGVIVPSNQSLQGKTNVLYALELLVRNINEAGFHLKKISFIEENIKSIKNDLLVFSRSFDIVVIIANPKLECVSQSLSYIASQEVAKIKEFETTHYEKFKIVWPSCVKLLTGQGSTLPVIYFQRMLIVEPELIQEQVTIVVEYLKHYQMENLYRKRFRLHLNGFKKSLEDMQNECLSVSYIQNINNNGRMGDESEISSKEFESVVAGELLLREKLGREMVLGSWVNEMIDAIYGSTDRHIQYALEVIENCICQYGCENIFLSFNGGKDCTVLLHLVQTVLEKKFKIKEKSTKLTCLYVRSEHVFKEQDEFVEQCKVYFNLEVITIVSNIKEALKTILQKKPSLKACFMGTRRNDPDCSHLNTFEMTDPDWPQVMRCSPLLDWHYSDIWDYILYYKVPYCKLYDYGYTSLGSSKNTIRNPNLMLRDGTKDVYLPAYKLLNENKERSGRNISKI